MDIEAGDPIAGTFTNLNEDSNVDDVAYSNGVVTHGQITNMEITSDNNQSIPKPQASDVASDSSQKKKKTTFFKMKNHLKSPRSGSFTLQTSGAQAGESPRGSCKAKCGTYANGKGKVNQGFECDSNDGGDDIKCPQNVHTGELLPIF